MYKRLLISVCCALGVIFVTPAFAESINLNAPNVLGDLNLDSKQLQNIKKAIEETLKNDTVDAVFQCGKDCMDCEVRIARQWDYDGDQYREVVVNVHTVGNSSITMANHKGKWPDITIK